MSRLGSWEPVTPEERLDRMESLAAIRQLTYRYAVALDSRDIDALVDLFTPDVRVGRQESGREALHRWFTSTMAGIGPSVHYVANHVVDFESADRARGIVYCRDELEDPESGEWRVGALQYWDTYVRIDGEWFFERRQFHRWYLTDALERPTVGAGVGDGHDALRTGQLPHAYPSWQAFWDRVAAGG